MKDETKFEKKLSEETTQKDEETSKKTSRRMQTLMEIQYGKDLSNGEIRASARLLCRKKTMMMCFKFLLKNGQSSVAEIRDGIRAEVENILSETDFERETFLKELKGNLYKFPQIFPKFRIKGKTCINSEKNCLQAKESRVSANKQFQNCAKK